MCNDIDNEIAKREGHPELDEAIEEIAIEMRRKQQGPLRAELASDMAKLAMFDKLVDALDEVTADYHHTDSAFWNSKIALVRRARAIK